MATVCLKNVRKVFDATTVAVSGFSLEIDDGEFVVLVGPSGCGKSTTLRMIAGLEEPTHGEIFIDDILANPLPPKDRDIAMVFQNYALYPHMTVYENLAFGLKLRKMAKGEIDERVREAADILGIGDLLDRRPAELSGGQRQRVAVGRTIVRKPKVFLFDEPLSNLDAKLRAQMRTEISKLHTQLGATMIYVTHDQVEAMTMGDRLVVMDAGDIQQVGAPVDLYRNPTNRFVAGFIGSPAMNFVNGQVIQSDGLIFEAGELRVHLSGRFDISEGRYVTLGIRPEHIRCEAEGDVLALVDVVEPMGNETYVYLRVDEKQITARLPGDQHPQVGELVGLAFDLDAIHLFDRETGERV
ncbi:MAG: sn-glycerol-3-phosphate ABC transporter ATP-binding protein UgpC [Candidatus Latescibacteria bacterium]|jgi:multiple sugar transport system ATP-binding protein|nr:sn-glycerol-3-phosphate ABC transporter ATP-binding protein UgpC [Candidatus Latescibacterota bacterium]